jgi:hypothetical protein
MEAITMNLKNPVDKVFFGMALVFLLASFFFMYFSDRFFPSGEFLGISLGYWAIGSAVIAVLIVGSHKLVVWFTRRRS